MIALALAAGCDSGGSSSDEPAPPPAPRQIAAAGLADRLHALDLIARQRGGDRAAGTAGYARSAAYVADTLRRLGWRVRLQFVPMTAWP